MRPQKLIFHSLKSRVDRPASFEYNRHCVAHSRRDAGRESDGSLRDPHEADRPGGETHLGHACSVGDHCQGFGCRSREDGGLLHHFGALRVRANAEGPGDDVAWIQLAGLNMGGNVQITTLKAIGPQEFFALLEKLP